MSADAKVWVDDDEGWLWCGTHDGPCNGYHQNYGLSDVLDSIERCMTEPNHAMRWQIFTYQNGTTGLKGYIV